MCQAKRRMSDQDMTASLFAEVPVAHLGLLVAADKIRTVRDLDVVLLPEDVGANWRAGMRPAGAAMAITHLERHAGDFDRHAATKTASCVRLPMPPPYVREPYCLRN